MDHIPSKDSEQSPASVSKNISFFRDSLEAYNKKVQELDTYKNTRLSLNEALKGTKHLLDIGNGGVFDYDTDLIPSITAIDLFLDALPRSAKRPPNVVYKSGTALAIPEPDETYDTVLLAMVIHHLVGKTVRESIDNSRRAIQEALRVLRRGGKLVVVEACVPAWFYAFETLVYPVAAPIINKVLAHPATLLYPHARIAEILERSAQGTQVTRIPKGRWILEFGFKWPSVLTPVNPYRFVTHKPSS